MKIVIQVDNMEFIIDPLHNDSATFNSWTAGQRAIVASMLNVAADLIDPANKTVCDG